MGRPRIRHETTTTIRHSPSRRKGTQCVDPLLISDVEQRYNATVSIRPAEAEASGNFGLHLVLRYVVTQRIGLEH